MPNIYLRFSDGSDASDGLSWANAKATAAGAFTAMSAGDTMWVSQAHAETQGTSMSLTSPGTVGNPCKMICVNDGAQPPTATATGATLTTTATTNITFAGYCHAERISFSAGSGAVTGNMSLTGTNIGWDFEDCAFILPTTGTASLMSLTSSTSTAAQYARLKNCTVAFGNVNQNISVGAGHVQIYGGSIAATGVAPNAEVFTTSINTAVFLEVIGTNISGVTSGALVNNSGGPYGFCKFVDCSIGSGVSLMSGTPSVGGTEVWLFNCDFGATNYKLLAKTFEGDLSSETTIVRTGGSSDGTTPRSVKMLSSASVSIQRPLYSHWLYGPWIDSTGSSKTATVEFVRDSASNLNDNEIWLELFYLGSSSLPIATFAHDRIVSYLTAAVAQTDSSVAWTTTGLTTPNTQKCHVTFTPQMKGYVFGRIALARVSTTVYIDDQMTVA